MYCISVFYLLVFIPRFLSLSTLHFQSKSYKILAPQKVKDVADLKKVGEILLEESGLDPELYRLGHTKVWTPDLLLVCLTPFFCNLAPLNETNMQLNILGTKIGCIICLTYKILQENVTV